MLKTVGEWEEKLNWKTDQNSYSDSIYIWNPNNLKYFRKRGKAHKKVKSGKIIILLLLLFI